MCMPEYISKKKKKNNESIWTNSLKIYILVKIELTWMSKENQINTYVELKNINISVERLFIHLSLRVNRDDTIG